VVVKDDALSTRIYNAICDILFANLGEFERDTTERMVPDEGIQKVVIPFLKLVDGVITYWQPDSVLFKLFCSANFVVTLSNLWRSPTALERESAAKTMKRTLRQLEERQAKAELQAKYVETLLTQIGLALIDSESDTQASLRPLDVIFDLLSKVLINTSKESLPKEKLAKWTITYLLPALRGPQVERCGQNVLSALNSILVNLEVSRKDLLNSILERLLSIRALHSDPRIESMILRAWIGCMERRLIRGNLGILFHSRLFAMAHGTKHYGTKFRIINFLGNSDTSYSIFKLWGNFALRKLYEEFAKWIECESGGPASVRLMKVWDFFRSQRQFNRVLEEYPEIAQLIEAVESSSQDRQIFNISDKMEVLTLEDEIPETKPIPSKKSSRRESFQRSKENEAPKTEPIPSKDSSRRGSFQRSKGSKSYQDLHLTRDKLDVESFDLNQPRNIFGLQGIGGKRRPESFHLPKHKEDPDSYSDVEMKDLFRGDEVTKTRSTLSEDGVRRESFQTPKESKSYQELNSSKYKSKIEGSFQESIPPKPSKNSPMRESFQKSNEIRRRPELNPSKHEPVLESPPQESMESESSDSNQSRIRFNLRKAEKPRPKSFGLPKRKEDFISHSHIDLETLEPKEPQSQSSHQLKHRKKDFESHLPIDPEIPKLKEPQSTPFYLPKRKEENSEPRLLINPKTSKPKKKRSSSLLSFLRGPDS
jgi:hypothetical protein